MVEFQWFLMALSVRPGMYLAISAHLLPYLNKVGVTFDGLGQWRGLIIKSIVTF